MAIAILLSYGGIDEIFKIHLQLSRWFSGLGSRGWLGIYLAVFLVTPLLLYPDFHSLWRYYRRETVIAISGMIVFALGGFGAELVRDGIQPLLNLVLKTEVLTSFIENLRIAFEEVAELVGESLILYSALCFYNQRIQERKSI